MQMPIVLCCVHRARAWLVGRLVPYAGSFLWDCCCSFRFLTMLPMSGLRLGTPTQRRLVI